MGLWILSIFVASPGKTKDLPVSYIQENIDKFLNGQTVYFAPLKTDFKVCYQRVGYEHAPVPRTTQIKESTESLSPKIHRHFKSYQLFSVQRAHQERVDLIGICPFVREEMIQVPKGF